MDTLDISGTLIDTHIKIADLSTKNKSPKIQVKAEKRNEEESKIINSKDQKLLMELKASLEEDKRFLSGVYAMYS